MLNSPLRTHAAARPDQIALILGERRLSYAQLVIAIDQAAAGLAALGVDSETRVVTCLTSSIEHVLLLYAVARIGATVATLDAGASVHELRQALADFDPQLAFAEDSCVEKLREASVNRALRVLSPTSSPAIGEILAHESEKFARPVHAGRYLVQYTSGSTGRPKGVVQTQRGLQQRLLNWNLTARLDTSHTHLCILPLSHGYGCYCVVMPALASGGTLHLYDLRHLNPLGVARYIKTHDIRCFYALPFFYQVLASLTRDIDVDFEKMHLRMSASAPLTEETARAFAERFGAKLHNAYGLSEIGIIASNLDHEPGVPLCAVGKLIAGIEHREVSPEDPQSPEVTELVVRSDGIAEGYFSSEHGPLLRQDWLYTGDLVRRDSRGNFVIVGRKTESINVMGNKVMPGEVEATLQQLPGVLESAVIGVADAITGECVAAFIVTSEALTENQVRAHCAQRLTGFKVPRHVRFVTELPKNFVGKVQKVRLKLEPS